MKLVTSAIVHEIQHVRADIGFQVLNQGGFEPVLSVNG
jgi:hypothetical protein